MLQIWWQVCKRDSVKRKYTLPLGTPRTKSLNSNCVQKERLVVNQRAGGGIQYLSLSVIPGRRVDPREGDWPLTFAVSRSVAANATCLPGYEAGAAVNRQLPEHEIGAVF